jgi:hypothetical protein
LIYLFLNFPQALQTAEQVAAPQQEAPRDNNWKNVSGV